MMAFNYIWSWECQLKAAEQIKFLAILFQYTWKFTEN